VVLDENIAFPINVLPPHCWGPGKQLISLGWLEGMQHWTWDILSKHSVLALFHRVEVAGISLPSPLFFFPFLSISGDLYFLTP
jgi:hypothetical protein